MTQAISSGIICSFFAGWFSTTVAQILRPLAFITTFCDNSHFDRDDDKKISMKCVFRCNSISSTYLNEPEPNPSLTDTFRLFSLLCLYILKVYFLSVFCNVFLKFIFKSFFSECFSSKVYFS